MEKHRREVLTAALARRGLELRSDYRLCEEYIVTGQGDVDHIVAVPHGGTTCAALMPIVRNTLHAHPELVLIMPRIDLSWGHRSVWDQTVKYMAVELKKDICNHVSLGLGVGMTPTGDL